jgi:hypothetical protein
MEEFYTPAEVTKILRVSVDTVYRIFERESGVILFTSASRLAMPKTEAKALGRYRTMRIPKFVLRRVLDRYLEALPMESMDQRFVDLQQRFPAGAYNERHAVVRLLRPGVCDRCRETSRRIKNTTSRSVHSDKIRVTELTYCFRPILLSA